MHCSCPLRRVNLVGIDPVDRAERSSIMVWKLALANFLSK